jgi:anti-sigma factor RsiW
MERGMNCDELVELVTDYLDDRMAAGERARFETHLQECEACVAYVEQIRIVARLSGESREPAVTALALKLLPAFRAFTRTV